ncbi:MAG: TonB family protein [candidate division KSB1 bacterium]|nr:TonB family protein [candidate division KSB1 bacterium]
MPGQMKRALVISTAAHFGIIIVLWQVGQAPARPPTRGSPRTITARLIEKPAVVKTAPVQEPPKEQPASPPTPKPVPSTKPPAKTKAEPKPQKTTLAPPNAQRTPEKDNAVERAPSGGHALKIDAVEFPFPHYLVLLQYRIETNWQPPPTGGGTHVATIYFKIARDGQLLEAKLEKSSGNYIFDQAALRAVQRANPLPPLPAASNLQILGVHFDFVAY